MTRRYGERIAAVLAADADSLDGLGGAPRGFVWRGRRYAVCAVLATWHLRDRWWATPEAGAPAKAPMAGAMGVVPDGQVVASDRHYYRLACSGGMQCEVYHDAVSESWVLDRVYD